MANLSLEIISAVKLSKKVGELRTAWVPTGFALSLASDKRFSTFLSLGLPRRPALV
jgi:hypothetical protein